MSEVGLAAVVLQILGLAMPLFFQIIIDKVVTHHAQTTLHILALGMLAAILFEAAFGWLRSYLLLYATSVIDLRLAIRTFEHLSSISLPFFEKNPAGVLIKHMQQPEKVREFLTGRLFGAMLDSVSFVVVLFIILAYPGTRKEAPRRALDIVNQRNPFVCPCRSAPHIRRRRPC